MKIKLIIITFTYLLFFQASNLAALELSIKDLPAVQKQAHSNEWASLATHAQLLLNNEMFAHADALSAISKMKILDEAESAHLSLGDEQQDWFLQLRVPKQARLRAWWQDLLEHMQCQVPELGIEVDGIRFQQQQDMAHIMGRSLTAVPAAFMHKQESADITLLTKNAESPIELSLSESGMRLHVEIPVMQHRNQQFIDKEFLKKLPQEIYAWQSIVVNEETRGLVLQSTRVLFPLMRTYHKQLSERRLQSFLETYKGEMFFGISNGRSGLDISIALEKNKQSENLVSALLAAPIDEQSQSLVCLPGKTRWVISSSTLMAEIISEKRSMHFPQQVPDALIEQSQTVAAIYVNTLALAQKYYDLLPALRLHNERIGGVELDGLRHSLRHMIPHLKETVLTVQKQKDSLGIEGRGVAHAAVMGLGVILCHPNSWTESKKDNSQVASAFERVRTFVDANRHWPDSMRRTAANCQNYCYLRPEEGQDYDLPVIIGNPARHAGRGSFVAFSNGEIQFIRGRALWNQAMHLLREGGSSEWNDWRNYHSSFAMVQNADGRFQMEERELQLFLNQVITEE